MTFCTYVALYIVALHVVASHTCACIPGPPVFQRATLKSWEWPGDEARETEHELIAILNWLCHVYSRIQSVATPCEYWEIFIYVKGHHVNL